MRLRYASITALTVISLFHAGCMSQFVNRPANESVAPEIAKSNDFNMKDRALKRFLRYVVINTQSDGQSNSVPSTQGQFDLARLLVDELKELGLQDISLDENCIVIATLPANSDKEAPTIGFLAHMDTSPAISGEGVKPRVINAYDGGDIVLNKEKNIVISAAEDSRLQTCVGNTIVTSDGSTLLGADDKAGIAAIMTMLETLKDHPDIPHGELKIAFTPDEEIGRGVAHFDVNKFGADYAYTVDGGIAGELNMETFSANSVVINVEGFTTHPGRAKDIMVNAIRVIAHIVSCLPQHMAPETTEGYEPYIHPGFMTGNVEKASVRMILRDFHTPGLDTQKKILETIIAEVQPLYPKARITLEVTESYRNMRNVLEKHPNVTGHLFAAAEKASVAPRWIPIRGGTDGSRLTALGLPTPNIFTGGANYHSRKEWLSVDGLVKAVETMLNIVRLEPY
ncbi:peptidase T [Candidatus Latescibacterota bacterium]